MEFEAAFKSDIGLRRKINEDNGIMLPDLGLFVVADGMGGHQGGDTASQMVKEIVPATIRELIDAEEEFQPDVALSKAIGEANEAIYHTAINTPGLQGMGTTAIAALFHQSELFIGHVGDSRLYFLDPKGIWQLTRDHSLVEEKLRAGIINREQMKTDAMKNVITRSVGFELGMQVEIYRKTVQPGEVFLMCSDGLSGQVEDADILKVTQETVFQNNDLEGAVQTLVDKANAAGGEDNVTVLMIRVKSV